MTPEMTGFARRGCAVIGLALVVGLSNVGCDHRAAPLAHRKWQIKEHQPGKYVAEYAEREHSATIAILYDGQSARIDYVDSKGLLYAQDSSGEVIHRNYNTWVKNL